MKALVTGGAGFLGRGICRRLVERGDVVLSVSRGSYPELADQGIEHHAMDLSCGEQALVPLLESVDVVFHCAARAGVFGPQESYLAPNVDGTQAVYSAARQAKVRAFVHTSSPSACFDGRDHRRADDLPLATHFMSAYPASKARAEKMLQRGLSDELPMTILRPHLMFGPGDPHLIPRLIEKARRRKLIPIRPQQAPMEVSLTYIDNAVDAHLAAAQTLLRQGVQSPAHGRAYFIANSEPVDLWQWIAELLQALDLPTPKRRISATSARILGALLETLWKTLPLPGEPPLTPFVAAQLSTSHSYDMARAQKDLGFRESVSMAEATRRTIAHYLTQ